MAQGNHCNQLQGVPVRRQDDYRPPFHHLRLLEAPKIADQDHPWLGLEL
jgi:hypothetical protein